MKVKNEKIDGKQIEVHQDRFCLRRYWAKVDGHALFQRGRMRMRMFSTADAAWKAALKKARP